MKLIKDNCRALCFGGNNFNWQMQDGGKSGYNFCRKGRESKTKHGLTMTDRCQKGKSSAGQRYCTEVYVMGAIL